MVVVLKDEEGGREGERYREKERKEERIGRRQRGWGRGRTAGTKVCRTDRRKYNDAQTDQKGH